MPDRAPRRARARLVVIAASCALAVGGCVGPLAPAPTPVHALDDMKTDVRSVDAFSSVSADGRLNIVMAAGALPSVEVDAPSNVAPLIVTEVSGSDLFISVAAPGYTSDSPATVRIAAPKLESVSLTNGATGTIEATSQSLSASVSRGSVLRGIGNVRQLSVTTLGNSDAQLGDLASETASISAAGGAKATLRVSKQLTGTADSGSIITLVVAPTAQSVTVTGGAKVVGP